MKKYIKPSIAKKALLAESSLLEGSITEGVIDEDDPGQGTAQNPIILGAPQLKNYNVWDD